MLNLPHICMPRWRAGAYIDIDGAACCGVPPFHRAVAVRKALVGFPHFLLLNPDRATTCNASERSLGMMRVKSRLVMRGKLVMTYWR